MSGEAASTLSQAATANPQLDFLVRTNMDAQIAADRIRGAVRASNGVSYPRWQSGQPTQTHCQDDPRRMRTRVFYASMGGFDTHFRTHQIPTPRPDGANFANAINAFHRIFAKAATTNGS